MSETPLTVTVAVLSELYFHLEFTRAATTMVPDAEEVTVLVVAKVPLSEVVPASTVAPAPDTETLTVIPGSIPVTVTVFEVYCVLKDAFETSVKLKVLGTSSCARVVIVKVSETPPIVATTLTAVE